MKSPESSSAIQRLKTNGVDELAQLFVKNRDSLRAMLDCRIRGRLAARFDASDVIQESYIRAKQRLQAYLNSPTIPPVVWLRIVCKQILTESIRKNLRIRRSPEFEIYNSGDQLIVERIADSLHSVTEAMARKELVRIVSEILKTMNRIDREIIEMRHNEGLSFPKIAELTDLKMETAKKRYYRAIEKFRECLGQE